MHSLLRLLTATACCCLPVQDFARALYNLLTVRGFRTFLDYNFRCVGRNLACTSSLPLLHVLIVIALHTCMHATVQTEAGLYAKLLTCSEGLM